MTDAERIAALKAERDRALARAYELSVAYLRTLDSRHVGPTADARGVRARLRSELTDAGEDAEAVVADMAAALDPGIVASTGPRYYGFVIGGAVPAAWSRGPRPAARRRAPGALPDLQRGLHGDLGASPAPGGSGP